MRYIDQLYEFRLANVNDIDAIMAFYKEEWNPGHILANDREFFCYQHARGTSVNFMLAINRESGAIEGAEGFIQYSEKLCDIGAVMWKVGKHVKIPFLGVEVVKRLKQATGCRVYLGPGANPKTAVPLHRKMLRHHVGKLEHFYMLADTSDYRIAVITEKRVLAVSKTSGGFRLMPVLRIDELDGKFIYEQWYERKPFKDRWYLRRRYFDHPIYQYKALAVAGPDGQIPAVIFAREIEKNGGKILRIVDVAGDTSTLAFLHKEFAALIEEKGYEYVDIYSKGVPPSLLEGGGFIHKDENDPNIIPNFFEPFLQKNIDLWYSLSDDEAVLFKADGDQDRPNSRQPSSTGA